MGKIVFKLVSIILFLLALSPFFLMLASASTTVVVINPTVVTIEPIADSFVNSTAPDANYGADTRLRVGSDKITYLMFGLPDLPVNVSIGEARLELYATSGSASGDIDVHHCPDDSWIESSITWNNRPSYDTGRLDRIDPKYWTGWENPWYVTETVQKCYQESDKKITLVIVSSNSWASYGSREYSSKPRLIISYLTSPAYTVHVEATDETGRTSNEGIIVISDQFCSLPNEILVNPGTYPLEYLGDYEFLRWETNGSISVASSTAEATDVEIQGAGLIRAVGRSADLTLESVQNTGTTSNIGYIVIEDDFLEERHFLPHGIPLIKPGTYSVSYEGGYSFIRWETVGNISISDPTQPTTTVMISAGSSTLRAVGNAEVMEYAYDDGQVTQTYHYKSGDAGSMYAVRFTPLFSGKLLNAHFYIGTDPNIFKIHVMDKNRNQIIAPYTCNPSTEGWFVVDLTTFNIHVDARNDFYVGFEWVQEGKPSIGYDDNDPSDDRSWFWNGTSWNKYPEYNDIMIRTRIETTMLPSQITCSLYPVSIAYKEQIEISGSIYPSNQETAESPVTLQYSSNGISWFNITTVSCASSSYSYSWTPTLPVGSYLVRATWQGSETYFSSESESQELTIIKAYSTLTCSFNVEKTEINEDVTVSGQISPAISITKIVLIFTNPEKVQFNQTVWTSSVGHFDTTMTPNKEGTWKVKAYWAGNENYHNAESSISELNVERFPYELIGLLIIIAMVGLAIFFIYRRKRRKSLPKIYTPPSSVRQPIVTPKVSPPQEAKAESIATKVGSGLIKIYVILFRRSISAQEYAERARSALSINPNAVVVGTPPSDENFAKNVIREVCGDIWSTPPVPEVKIEKDDPQYFRSIPGVAGGGMNDYAISFLKRKIAQGEDPDYFNIHGYTVYVTTTTDSITGDGALIIRINR